VPDLQDDGQARFGHLDRDRTLTDAKGFLNGKSQMLFETVRNGRSTLPSLRAVTRPPSLPEGMCVMIETPRAGHDVLEYSGPLQNALAKAQSLDQEPQRAALGPILNFHFILGLAKTQAGSIGHHP
jgi:hypothetical protein